MKYCKKCRHINNDEEVKCKTCGKPLEKITDDNTPVYLLTAEGFELQRVKTALEDCGIPCDNISQKHSFSAEAVTGYDNGEYDILVPYSAYETAYDTCVGIGAINEGEAQIVDDDGTPVNEGAEPLDEQFEKMSGVKRTTVRVVSAILFLLLVALVIYGTDFITGLIKNLF